jgi:hypothetical protein
MWMFLVILPGDNDLVIGAVTQSRCEAARASWLQHNPDAQVTPCKLLGLIEPPRT